MSSAEDAKQNTQAPREVILPAPTVWPLVLAFGATLLFTGLLTNVSVTVLGAILSLAGSVGWFREVFPHEREEHVAVVGEEAPVSTSRPMVRRFPFAEAQVRAWLPLETYPISAGLKGGLAGGVAMAALACTYGLLSVGSIWYPINLLGAVIYSQSEVPSAAQLHSFHGVLFFFAVILHLTGSVLVGLLYGAMLPMIARHPIVLGGLIGPILWSGLLYTTLGLLNPLLGSLIHWGWFIASQIAFGVVAGLVVLRQHRVPTKENIPFAIRAGIEAPGMMPGDDGAKRP